MPAHVGRTPFVGREQELGRLGAAFDDAADGQGSLVMIAGEPGIGKTALCSPLLAHAAEHGGRALSGHCYEEGSLSLPYQPFVEALGAYVRSRDSAELLQELGADAIELARILPELRQHLPESVGARHASPRHARRPTRGALPSF